MLHQEKVSEEWRQEELPPFNELMLSWNAKRPLQGRYLFYISVKTEAWSPYLLYATWGSDGQMSFLSKTEEAPVRVYQDAVEVLEGHHATGFRLKILQEGRASIDELYHLHVYTNGAEDKQLTYSANDKAPIHLPVPGISQMKLPHARYADLCSPVSTAAVTRFLTQSHVIDPVHFAAQSWDLGFDIFGNWVFNVAQASTELGKDWQCWVERLGGFDDIYDRLKQGTPVIVSVRGPLPGSALPYTEGHLMAVIGYDPSVDRVICMDPAFASDATTHVAYDLSDFTKAWNRRGKIAYVFKGPEERCESANKTGHSHK